MTGRSEGRLLGRDAELARLRAALAEVRDGVSRTVLVGGDAGVGKTRLVTEFLRAERDAGIRALVGGATDLAGGDLPFAPVAAAVRSLVREEELAGRVLRLVPPPLRPLVPELRARDERPAWSGTPSETGRLALFGGVLGLLVELADPRPVVLVLEDVHWADDSTRDLLSFLALHLGDVPVLVVATYRTDELHRTHPLRPALAELTRLPAVSSIDLPPLPPGLVAELCRDLSGGVAPADVVDDVVARSQGNPFAVEELVRAHAGGFRGLPASISELLLLRLEEVPAETLAVLRLVAVVGRPVGHELLAALSEDGDDGLEAALRPAIERHLVVAEESGYRFRHALLAEAIVGTLLPGERRRLHHRVAQVLTDRPDQRTRTTPLAELAHHRHLAGDVPEAVAVAYEAAAEVEETGAYGEAARLLVRVLEHWDQVDAGEVSGATRREVLARAAELSYWAGDAAQATRLCRAAMEEVDPTSDPVAAGLLHERLGRYRWVASVEEDLVLATYEQAVALVPATPSPERARVLAAHGQALMLMRRLPEAVERCREALDIATQTEARSAEGHARNSMGTSLAHLGRVEEGLAELRRALVIASDLGDLDEIGRVQANASEAMWMAGHVDDVLVLAEEALGAVDGFQGAAIGGWHLPCIAGVAAEALALRGDWERSLALVDRYRWPGHGYGGRWLGIAAARVELARGDVEAAARYLAEADAARGSLDIQTRPRALLAHAGLAAARGEDGVFELAGTLLDELEEASDIEYLTLVTASELAVLLDSLPRTAERERLLRRCVSVGERASGAVAGRADPVVALRLAEARIRAVAAEGAAAADAWGEVVSVAAAAGFLPAEAHARARRAEVLLAGGGDREQAAADLTAALAVAEDLGAAPLAERVRATAARARLPLAGAARQGGPAGLTPREVEVLGLVAAGLTNPEIGRRLHISEKTASVHVSRILRKLEVTNRVEAAVLAQRFGIRDDDVTA